MRGLTPARSASASWVRSAASRYPLRTSPKGAGASALTRLSSSRSPLNVFPIRPPPASSDRGAVEGMIARRPGAVISWDGRGRVCEKSWDRRRLARPRRLWERGRLVRPAVRWDERLTSRDAPALRGWLTHAHGCRGGRAAQRASALPVAVTPRRPRANDFSQTLPVVGLRLTGSGLTAYGRDQTLKGHATISRPPRGARRMSGVSRPDRPFKVPSLP